MKKPIKFTLQNVWGKRKEFLRAAKAAGAWCSQYEAAVEAKSKEEFMNVVLRNLHWVFGRGLIYIPSVRSVAGCHTINRKLYVNIYLHKNYLGTDDWVMDSEGYLAMPYYDKNDKGNWYLADPPLYKYVEKLQAMLDAGQKLPELYRQP